MAAVTACVRAAVVRRDQNSGLAPRCLVLCLWENLKIDTRGSFV